MLGVITFGLGSSWAQIIAAGIAALPATMAYLHSRGTRRDVRTFNGKKIGEAVYELYADLKKRQAYDESYAYVKQREEEEREAKKA